MRELRLVAVSDDGTRLILKGDDSEYHMSLPIDEKVHAAVRGDRARLDQAQQESSLRPRDIQARVRSGESVESLSDSAGVSLEKVLRFAGPVLAERAHVAERAQNAVIRRIGGDNPSRPLSETVAEWVSRSDIDPESVQWDAWRRDDGKWQVVAEWPAGESEAQAKFTFDPTGRSVLPDDDEARAVAGEVPAPPSATEPEAEAAPSGQARLSVVADPEPKRLQPVPAEPVDEGPAAFEAEADDQPTMPVPVNARRGGRGADSRRLRPGSTEARAARSRDEQPDDRLRLTDIASKVEVDEEPEPERTAIAAGASPQQPAKRSGRGRGKPAVPSWDEIMFGRRDQ